MSMLVPQHLREIADVIACDAVHGCMTLQLVCPCGCQRFRVYESCPTADEQVVLDRYQAECQRLLGHGSVWSRIDASGNVHLFRHGILGLPREIPLPLPDAPPFADFHSVKVICADCQREYLLFDCRIHGYDGAICGTDCPADYTPHFRQKFTRRAPERRLRVTITQDMSQEELFSLAGECGGVDAAMAICSECFTGIAISAESDGKSPRYICFFEQETS